MSRRTRRPKPPRQGPRCWTDAPVLAEWVLALLAAGNGVTVCEHLTTTDGTIDTLNTRAAYIPQVDARILCRPCASTALDAHTAAMDAGLYYPPCAVCGGHPRPVTQWQTQRGAPFLAMAWICDACVAAAGAAS